MNEPKGNALVEFRHQFDLRQSEFTDALPKHIPVERFRRVVMTAIQTEPKLLMCDRRSLFNAALKCAADGLQPDGREAALVPHKDTKNNKAVAQYFPMVGGIRKKARNSGEIATWDVHAVYENDQFEYELGDDPFIKHRPTLGERGKLIAVYSVCVLKSGEKSRDVMSLSDVMKIRALSRGTNTPWANPTFFPEMAKKTVAKRHSKVLPTSTDLDDLMRQDDALYDLEGASDKAIEAAPRRPSLGGKLDALAAPASAAISRPAEDFDQGGGDGDWSDDQGEGAGDGDASAGASDPQPAKETAPAPAEKPAQAQGEPKGAKAPPKAAPAASTPAKPNPAEALVAAGEVEARKGTEAFKAWWLRLDEADMRWITDKAEARLREIATEADARL